MSTQSKRIPEVEVTILRSPITERYIRSGYKGKIDYNVSPPQIRVNGVWFTFDEKRWKVVTEENKKEEFLKTLINSVDGVDYLSDKEFVTIRDSFGMTEHDEDMIIQWMIESKKFRRFSEGFSLID